jgi:rhomboid protease GluP
MENPFYTVMAPKSNEELHTIVMQRDRYEPEAIIAALEELERRGLGTPELQQQKESVYNFIQEREQEKIANTMSSGSALDLLKPGKIYFYTPIILYLNVAVWLVMIVMGVDPMEPSVPHLIDWGGNLRGLTLNGEQWRLFTNIFLHGGAFHLAFNMYALVSIGSILEPAFGKHRYLLCYIATGILASITSIAFNDNIVSVGASGAIFGLDGLLLALLITKNINIPQEARKSLLTSTLIFIGYNLFYGFAKTGIDNAAHIGGLVSGFIFGLLYYLTVKQPERSKLISGVIALVVIASVVLAPKFISDKYGEYQVALEKFGKNEEKALWMYEADMSDSTNTQNYQARLRNEGTFLWKENIALLNSLDDMPEHLQQRIDLLLKYSQLRIKSCEAFSTLVADYTDENIENVNAVEDEVNAVIKELEALNK